jgi:hypothetical protein
MGGRYVELFRVSRAEMLQALEQFVGGYMNNNLHMQGGMGGGYTAMGGYHMAPYQPAYQMGAPACGGPGSFGAMAPQPMPMAAAGGGGAMMGAPAGGGKPGTLRMRGLPFKSTVDDISRFFSGFQIMPGGIVLGHREGRATGEAWVTFASPAESQRAMCLNNKNLGSRYVELFAA